MGLPGKMQQYQIDSGFPTGQDPLVEFVKKKM
jgi:hypothetical protein